MKKAIILFIWGLFAITTVNAQIKKPSVKVKVNKHKTHQVSPGVLLKSSVKLKTLKDFNKLNIPVTKITKEQLNAKPIRSWKITPLKLKDGVLKLASFTGSSGLTYWSWYTETRGANKGNNANKRRLINELESGTVNNNHHTALPFTIKFRVTGGVEYRLKIEQRVIIPSRHSNFLYIKKGNYITKIQKGQFNSFNYIFKEARSSEIEISFSGVVIPDETISVFNPLRTEKIEIDRIN